MSRVGSALRRQRKQNNGFSVGYRMTSSVPIDFFFYDFFLFCKDEHATERQANPLLHAQS